MTLPEHIFADRLSNLSITGNLVRLELAALQAPAVQGGEPQLMPTQTSVMPLEGFLPSFSMMETMVKKLVADGVLKVQPPQDSV